MEVENSFLIISQYLSVLQVETRPNTARLYEAAILRFSAYCTKRSADLFLPEAWSWGDVGVQALERYLHQSRQELGWSANTTHAHLTAIRHFFRHLTRSGHLDRNPIQHYTRQKSAGLIKPLEVDPEVLASQLQQLPCKTHKQLVQCLLLELTYSTGVSVAQLCRVENLEPLPQSGSLRIHFSKRLPLERPLGEHGFALLQHYLKMRKHSTAPQSSAPNPQCPPFWVDGEGRALLGVQLKKLLEKPLQELGVPNANALRDAGLQHLAAAGADTRTLQNYRGLKRLQRVQDYKNPAFGELQERLLAFHPRRVPPASAEKNSE